MTAINMMLAAGGLCGGMVIGAMVWGPTMAWQFYAVAAFMSGLGYGSALIMAIDRYHEKRP